MPQQELFYEQKSGDRRIEIVKTYDRQFAREAFTNMDEASQAVLWNSLGIEDHYDPTDLPSQVGPESEEFLWEELLEAPREYGNELSFFVVNEARGSSTQSLYVSPDWPSAEAFAKHHVDLIQ